jgi:hypothetical protein
MMAAFRAHKWFLGGLRVPFALVEQAARPIMEFLVPWQKLGVMHDLMQYELARLGDDAHPDAVSRVLARVVDSVDNRLGQLVYDNLFWHKVLKDLSLVSVRSVGWNIGTPRELGGAVWDTAQQARRGETPKAGFEGMTPRQSYFIGLHLLAGLGGAIAFYLIHQKAPEHLIDYYFPRDAHGRRWQLPTYIKDEYAWTHDPVGTAKGKVHPLVQTLWEMIGNRDFFDKPIVKPNDPLVNKAEKEAEFILKQYEPLGLRPPVKGHTPTPEERALSFFGIRPAPKALQEARQ